MLAARAGYLLIPHAPKTNFIHNTNCDIPRVSAVGAKNPFSTFWRAVANYGDFRASSARHRSLKSARGRQKVTDARES